MEKYSEELKVVQSNSFAIYKHAFSKYQIFVNCFAVALQKKRSGDSSRCEIEGAYRDWKGNCDEVILKDLMRKALEVSEKLIKKQPTMKNFFIAKPKVQEQQPNKVQDDSLVGDKVKLTGEQVEDAGGDTDEGAGGDRIGDPVSKECQLIRKIFTLFGLKSGRKAIEEISKKDNLVETLKSVEKAWENFEKLSKLADNISCYHLTNSVYIRKREMLDVKWEEIKEVLKDLAETSVIDPTKSKDLSIGEMLQYSQSCLTRAEELGNKLMVLSLKTVADF